jgi:hypothetical protein
MRRTWSLIALVGSVVASVIYLIVIQPIPRTKLKLAVSIPKFREPDHILIDSNEVFQRAFWKHPSSTDRILHAERNEWLENGEVCKWQWFIVVEPSPELLKYLRDDNAFGLARTVALFTINRAPEWFVYNVNEMDIFQNSSGNMKLIFGKNKNLLYATSTGGGFQPGVSNSAKSASSSGHDFNKTGRLPVTAPPPEGEP